MPAAIRLGGSSNSATPASGTCPRQHWPRQPSIWAGAVGNCVRVLQRLERSSESMVSRRQDWSLLTLHLPAVEGWGLPTIASQLHCILSVDSRAKAWLPGAARAVWAHPGAACYRTGSDCTTSSTDEIDCQTTWQGRSVATWRNTSCSSRFRRCGPTSASRTTARSALAAASPSTPGSGRPARCALFYSTFSILARFTAHLGARRRRPRHRQPLVRAARQPVPCSCSACSPSLPVVMHSGLR